MNKTQQQVMRMLALVPYLQDNDGIPVAKVAQEFGVKPRQISDDLSLLTLTGIGEFHGELIDFDLDALESEGVVRIRDAEFMARPLRLLTREAIALIVALRTLRASAGPTQRPIIDGALAKLETAIGGERVDAPVDIHVDPVDADLQQIVEHAVQHTERLEIEYATESRDTLSRRRVDPRRLFTENGQLYLEAWSIEAEGLRFFRVDRVLSAKATGEPSEEHEVKPRALSDDFFAPGDDDPYVVLDLEPRGSWITEYYQSEELDPGESGLRRVLIRSSDASWLRRLALRNAGDVHVVGPPEMVQDVEDAANAALAAYSDE